MLEKIKYYTLSDILNSYVEYKAPDKEPPYYPNCAFAESGWFAEMLSKLNLQLEYVGIKSNGSVIKTADVSSIIESLMNLIYARHSEDYIYKIVKRCDEPFDEEDESGLLYRDRDLQRAFAQILNTLQLTMPKYIPIIYQYSQHYEVPLDKIESISESFNRFNDTPQNEQDEVDFNTDDYATTMGRSKAVTKADTGSLVERIRALQEAWKSTILEWANEFNDDFIYDNQLEEF